MAPRKEKKGKKGTKAKHKRNTEEVQRFQKIKYAARNKMRDQNFKTIIIVNQFWGIYNSHCQ